MLSKFDNADDMWVSLLDDLLERGHRHQSRAGGTTELVGYACQLTNIKRNVITNPHRKYSANYACGELLWYLARTPSVKMLLPHAPGYARFADEQGNTTAAYGWRWITNPGFGAPKFACQDSPMSQLEAALELLRKDPGTRQCVLTMWDSGDLHRSLLGPPQKDVPCTCTMQFHVRDGKLHCSIHMRSNDAWLGFTYDVFCFSSIQRLMADALGLNYGTYTHFVGSMHLYDKNEEAASQALRHIFERRSETDRAMEPSMAEGMVCGDRNSYAICMREFLDLGDKDEKEDLYCRVTSDDSWMASVVACAMHKIDPSVWEPDMVLNPYLHACVRKEA